MDVLARPAAGREVGMGDFADITTVAVTEVEWADDGMLRVTFAADLTAAQVQRVRLRITSATAREEQLRIACAAFLVDQSPTLGDAIAVVKQLIRVVLTLDDSA